MTLDDIRKELERDTRIDDSALDTESLRIPQLHNKYMNFLLEERLMFAKYENEVAVVTRDKWEYYTGKMSEEQLAARGWEPFNLKILRNYVRGHVSESDIDCLPRNTTYSSGHSTRRHINHYICIAICSGRHAPGPNCPLTEGDGAMATRGGVSIFMPEEHTKVCASIIRWNNKTSVHICVPTWFVTEKLAHTINLNVMSGVLATL